MKDPRSILITGASAGIGAALARAYAGPGVTLILGGRNPERLAAVAAACRAAGAEVTSAAIDVTDAAALAAWIAEADQRRPIDLVIANAGMTGGDAGDGNGESLADVQRIMGVNFGGVCNTLHPLIPALRQRQRGQLVLMSSLAALRGLPYSPAYCASKAALKAYGEALGAWLRADGIEVSIVLPGFVDTHLSRHVSGPKPLQITAERAALLIRRRLERGPAVIAFPFLLYAGIRVLALLPAALADFILCFVTVSIRRYE
ncbi:MAG TPA: SDR family NAD(P)-dependent oxidoreductase [Stellaceae bacterium]|nr:SDR family NAD(P)-dependent oxidoreductase [Stellaceae bacterium]